ncbi:MAG: cation transporter [Candidatus Competibacteraceae bacterium]|jgi:Co/Zn/Cd efflux system component|nr:cation transporter [Candidatus Competibacteraceae bacterium]
MAGCSCNTTTFTGLSTGYRRVLWLVIGLNAMMFLIEVVTGMMAESMALQADALDFLGDTMTYTLTLWVIGRPQHWRATAALVKGFSLAAMGLGVLGLTLYQVLVLGVPNEFMMGTVGLIAFAVNLTSALLLLRYRDGDANVRSVWLCSRNDAIGNLAVVLAAVGVFATQTPWPDLLVAAIMASLFLHSAALIIRQALDELRDLRRTPASKPLRNEA